MNFGKFFNKHFKKTENKKQESTIRYETQVDEEYGDVTVEAYWNEELVGRITSRKESRAVAETAARMFPDVAKPTDNVWRVTGIEVDPKFRNKGIGKRLYLMSLAHQPNAWQYNSQATKEAKHTLSSLQKNGLIELYTQGTDGMGGYGLTLKKITNKGLEYLRKNN